VGFAIPVDTVKDSVAEIIANGRVVRPVLGIAFAPDSSTSQLGVNGILVLSVKDGGPASKVRIRNSLLCRPPKFTLNSKHEFTV
jgi:S1-C subfamily serine protease